MPVDDVSPNVPRDLDDLDDLIRVVRANLGLDVAFIGMFAGDERIVLHCDGASESTGLHAGQRDWASETYCGLIAEGRLPMLIPDTSKVEAARRLERTANLPVGSHLGVPIRLSDDTVFGTLCCFGHEADPSLTERDLAMIRTFADLAARRIERGRREESIRAAKRLRIETMIARGAPRMVFQPVYMAGSMTMAGAEALARFPDAWERPVDQWFAEAASVGLLVDLELAAIRNAIAAYQAIWRIAPVQLGLNASAATICDPRFAVALSGMRMDRLVIELTEHEEVRCYKMLENALSVLRKQGAKVAIDDVGAGFASMRHILEIRPDIVKLDMRLVRDINRDPMRISLVRSIVAFADSFACRVTAEGVETDGELATLRDLAVQAVQGYLLGRPMSVEALLEVLSTGPIARSVSTYSAV